MIITQALILSVIQGVTEFLPISSSGHLILIPEFFGWRDQGLAFDAIIHLGTTLAALLYFRKDLFDLIRGFFTKGTSDMKRVGYAILLSMIPALVIGLLFKSIIESQARTSLVVAFNLFLWGGVLIFAEHHATKNTPSKAFKDITLKQGLLIGVSQALALFPGTSRSGITLSTGLFLGIKREDAVKFSFLMGAPVIFGAGILSFLDLMQNSVPQGGETVLPIFAALLGSFVSGMLAIHLLLKVISKKGLYFFGIYRMILSAAILIIL
jgi:undecaprenyl-diphosphatase